jgi:hypothetical protein
MASTTLVGAIKLRVQEHGGEVRKLDALAEAQRVANESQYLADRNAMLHDGQWVRHSCAFTV